MDLSTLEEKTVDDEARKEQPQEETASEEDPHGLNYMGGKSGKGGGKATGKGGKSEDGPEKKKFEGYCNYCWKYGHRAADCFQNPKGKGKGKGKDGGGKWGGKANQWGPAKGYGKGKGISGLESYEDYYNPGYGPTPPGFCFALSLPEKNEKAEDPLPPDIEEEWTEVRNKKKKRKYKILRFDERCDHEACGCDEKKKDKESDQLQYSHHKKEKKEKESDQLQCGHHEK
eukprot:6892385-Karenia_brevis.AAC.1